MALAYLAVHVHVSNCVNRARTSGVSCLAALAASVIAFRYRPFLFLLKRDWKFSKKGDSCERARKDVVGDPNHEIRASCRTRRPLSFRLTVIVRIRAGHQGKPYILAQTMSPTHMVLPSGVTHLETFLEKTFIFKELVSFLFLWRGCGGGGRCVHTAWRKIKAFRTTLGDRGLQIIRAIKATHWSTGWVRFLLI